MNETERYALGDKMRRTVLGDEHVDRAQSRLTEFNETFQDFITRYAWGEIWTRTEFSPRVRSLVTLALLIALNREAEFRMHVRAAIRNGVTVQELKELFLHSGIYCGLPAANAAYHCAEEVLAELKIPLQKEGPKDQDSTIPA
jgi:4-carboxymuconolactone decarboxylase